MADFKKTLSFVLSFLLASQAGLMPLGSSVAWARDEVHEQDLKIEQKNLIEGSEKLAQGELLPITDPNHITGQYVEIFEGSNNGRPTAVYRLDSPSISLPDFAYTSLLAYYDKARETLVIEAQRGANDKGEHGQVVARHYIPRLKAVALARDAEILSIVDNEGYINAIDWGYVVQQVFKSPIPVFSKLVGPTESMDLSNSQVSASYLTVGTVPFRVEDVMSQAIIPFNENNEPLLTAGDLMVKVSDKVLGVYSRKVTHQRILEGMKVLQIQAELIKKDSESIAQLAADYEIQEKMSEQFKNDLAKMSESAEDPLVSLALQSLGKNQIQSLQSRARDHEHYRDRENDWFTLSEWNTRFAQIQANAAKSFPDLSPEALARDWQRFAGDNPQPVVNHEEEIHKIPKSFYWKMGGLVAGLSAFIVSPAVIEHFDLQQIAVINFYYANIPDVLKDASYRWPLLANTLALMGLWPAGIGISALSGKALRVLNRVVQNRATPLAQKIRDLAKNWVDLKSFQRITSFGMRFYAEVTLSLAIQLVEKMGRQKTFFTALNNGLNPFKRVQPESAEGRAAGITTPTFLGLNNPFLNKNQMTSDALTKIKMQSDLKGKKDRLKAHAWLLAAIAVAEQYEIDLSTLLTLEGNKNPTIEDLKGLLENPKARGEWEILTVELQRHIMELPYDSANGDLKEVSVDLIQQQYQIAREAAEKLSKITDSRKYLKQLRIKAKKWSLARVHDVMNLGRSSYTFLKSVYTNEYVSSQVEREFVSDHLLCVYLIALVGERADLSHPQNLAAAPTPATLWSTPGHLTDMGLNTYSHFFVAGARMSLQYQQVKPQEETAYQPYEDITVHSPDKEQSFWKGLARWLPDTLNPMKADLAQTLWGFTIRQMQTIQAYFIMNISMRMLLGNQSLHDAVLGSSIFWLASFWYIAWMWMPAAAGNNYHGNFFAQVNSRITAARRHILWASRQTDPEKAKAYLEQGTEEMKALYKELNPKAVDKIDLSGDLATQAQALLELSKTEPPLERRPNSTVVFLPSMLAALVTTYAAVPLIVATYDPALLNLQTLGQWMLITPALMSLVYWGYSGRAWSKYLPKLKSLFKKDCDDLLLAP